MIVLNKSKAKSILKKDSKINFTTDPVIRRYMSLAFPKLVHISPRASS
jgi:hypothetical protein